MWAQHDDVRQQLKVLQEALDTGDVAQIRTIFAPTSKQIEAMFHKEETILYPMALKVLSDAEWWAIREGSDEIGYCLIRPGDQWHPDISDAAAIPLSMAYAASDDEIIVLDTGALTSEQINLMLTHLPVDVTFVDENDTVRYYSQGPERVFVRTPAIIGRNVQNCHPPQSVHVVNELLEELKRGERDAAAFWIQMGDKFVHIRYIAVRDQKGRYRGTIEVTQEISGIKALEGERRLLDEIG